MTSARKKQGTWGQERAFRPPGHVGQTIYNRRRENIPSLVSAVRSSSEYSPGVTFVPTDFVLRDGFTLREFSVQALKSRVRGINST